MSRFGLTTSLSHHWCGSGSGFRHEKAEYRRRERISFEREETLRGERDAGEAEIALEFSAERRQTLAEKVTLRTTVKRRTGYGQI